MGLQTKPAYIGTAGFQNPVENDRNLLEYLHHRQGVLRKESFVAAPVAGAMQLNVGAGAAVLLGSASTQGGYFGYSDAAENIPWPASNGSNPRMDSLLMRVIDTQYGADAAGDLLRWEVVSGTAAAAPVALTDAQINSTFPHPGSWMRMYDVRVPTAVTNLTTATITRKFPYANSMGTLLYASAVESRPAGLFYGEKLNDITTGLEYWWNGTAWLRKEATVVKTADTSFASQAVLQDDPVLQFPVDANSTYQFEFEILWSAGSTPKYAHALKFPAGARMDYSRSALDAAGATFRDSQVNVASGVGTTSSPTPGGVGSSTFRGMIVTGATPGSVVFQAAQAASSATVCMTQRGSFVKHQQLA